MDRRAGTRSSSHNRRAAIQWLALATVAMLVMLAAFVLLGTGTAASPLG